MSFLRAARNWLAVQSDMKQSAICLGATSCLLPALANASPGVLAATNLLAISIQFGSQFYVAFVGGPTMYVNMEKRAFGDIQGRLFPKFGMVGLSTGVLAVATYQFAAHSGLSGNLDYTCLALLAGSFTTHIINSFALFPYVTKAMMELRAADKALEADTAEGNHQKQAARRAAAKRFGISHGISNLVNLASLGGNFAYLCILSSKLSGVW